MVVKRGKPRSAYRPQYGVIVMCRHEAHQMAVYATLKGLGYDLKVVVT